MKVKNSNNTQTDTELIAEYIKTGNRNFIAELYVRYTDFCFLVAMKYLKNETDAEDITMLVFEKLPKLLQAHRIDNFKPWLYSVVKNECLIELRKTNTELRNRKKFEDFSGNFMESDAEMHLFNNENDDKLIVLKKAVENLGTEQRKCIELFYFEEKSYDEITAATGFSGKQVKSFIQNGRRNLLIYMQKHGVELMLIIGIL